MVDIMIAKQMLNQHYHFQLVIDPEAANVAHVILHELDSTS